MCACSVASVMSCCLQPYAFSKQKHWSGLPCPPPGDLPDPGIQPMSPVSPALQMDSLPTEPSGKHTPTHTFSFNRCSKHWG